MIKHLNIEVYGLVQGIFFRASAKEQADKLGIVGFAQNQPDGSVYIEAEGEESKLDEFLQWCHSGPSLARIEKVKIIADKIKSFSQFTVN